MPDSDTTKAVCDLSHSITDLARDQGYSLQILFNALAMTYLATYIASRTSLGQDVEESDLTQAMAEFSNCLLHQAAFLLNFHPEVLKNEIPHNEGENV